MNTYLVGGAVRDVLLGKKPSDLDYVVVGSTAEEMLSQGFSQVGSDFPVFLHPTTHDEYALARTERKNGSGYNGFTCHAGIEVTLEEDLLRRDITINAMAQDLTTGEIIDPFGGRRDIENKVIRHVSPAFAEDPVRLLRAARFCATLGEGWTIAPETYKLFEEMEKAGEFLSLTPERVWKEVEKMLKTSKRPSIFFEIVSQYGLFPEYAALKGLEQRADYHPEVCTQLHVNLVMDYAAKTYNNPAVTFAALCHDLGKVIQLETGVMYGHEAAGVPIVAELCKNLKVPKNFKQLALKATEFHGIAHRAEELKPRSILNLFEKIGTLKSKTNLEEFLAVCVSDAKGVGFPMCNKPYPQSAFLLEVYEAVMAVNSAEIAKNCIEKGKNGEAIRIMIHEKRIKAIKEFKASKGN